MGYSELGADPKRRLKTFLWVVFADADAPNLDALGPKATAERNNEFPRTNMLKFKGFIVLDDFLSDDMW